MLVSWNWLREYVEITLPPEAVVERLMMAGLNHESTVASGDDLAIDLEVTSNRPDCLGHLGIAREAAVLLGTPLRVPTAEPVARGPAVSTLARVTLECPDLCPRYTARVLRGVKVAASPAWLARRLATLGIPAINNVVDVTNYVLLESGQPLHAFDLGHLTGQQIVVRRALPGEELQAIDHKTYSFTAEMCVIADAARPVALAGVMGGAATEVSPATRDVLLEAAEFAPRSVRATARALRLFSDSSYRFERGVDPAGVDWASRRACALILDLAGGELAAGVIDVGRPVPERAPIVLRLSQLPRVLGIDIDPARVRAILEALGNHEIRANASQVEVIPPSWRADLTREIDLVEEVARIHGYEAIPEDVNVPMTPSARTPRDRALARVRFVMTAGGFDEALTVSVVDEDWSAAFSWTEAPPLVSQTPLLRRATHLRRSLLPSLLGARRTNESLANPRIELFEIARVYLPGNQAAELPKEELLLGLTSGRDFQEVKGVLETLVTRLNPALRLEIRDCGLPFFAAQAACELWLAGEHLGYLGPLSATMQKRFDLRGPSTVAELRLELLVSQAVLVPQYVPLPVWPAVQRDLNFVVGEAVRWAELADVAQQAGGAVLEELSCASVYRDVERLGPGRKSLVLSLRLRGTTGTLTGEEADGIAQGIVAVCRERLGAELRA